MSPQSRKDSRESRAVFRQAALTLSSDLNLPLHINRLESRLSLLCGRPTSLNRLLNEADRRHPRRATPEWFTGSVRVGPLFSAPAPARTGAGKVTFEPGARTAWHTHPLGQTLIMTDGLGLVQREGGAVEEIRPGDVIWFSPGEKHWHGASPTTAMSHIAVQETLKRRQRRVVRQGDR